MHGGGGGGAPPGQKIMVVADPTQESAGALQYALSRVVFDNDELILFHVENDNWWRNTITMFLRKTGLMNLIPPGAGATTSEEGSLGREGMDFLEEMKHAYKVCKPKLVVRVEKKVVTDGKDKATTILDRSKALGLLGSMSSS